MAADHVDGRAAPAGERTLAHPEVVEPRELQSVKCSLGADVLDEDILEDHTHRRLFGIAGVVGIDAVAGAAGDLHAAQCDVAAADKVERNLTAAKSGGW